MDDRRVVSMGFANTQFYIHFEIYRAFGYKVKTVSDIKFTLN